VSSTPTQPTPLTPTQLNRSESAQWRQIVRQHGIDLRVMIPAFVTEDLGTQSPQTVTVQIAIQEQVRTPDGPAWYDLPPIINVPIVIPRGGGFSITLPIKKGDEGMLVFCDTCFDFWWKNGQANAPRANNLNQYQSPSGSQISIGNHRHEFWDCGFIPGMYSQPNVLQNYSTDSLQVRSDDGATIIDVSESGVSITGLGVDISVASGGVNVTGSETVDGNLATSSGASGSFTTPTGQTVTVVDGIIIDIST
jgi:hypothetical protein